MESIRQGRAVDNDNPGETRGKSPESENGKNPFPEWSRADKELQQEAREIVCGIPAFPELEKRLIEALGFGPAPIMLHQLVYWFSKPKMQDRWTAYKTLDEWKEERGLNRKQVDKGRTWLRSTGVVEERHGPYRRLHYRIDWVKLARELGVWVEDDDFDLLGDASMHPIGCKQQGGDIQGYSSVPLKGSNSTVPLKGAHPSVPLTNGSNREESPHSNHDFSGAEPLKPRTNQHRRIRQETTQENSLARGAEPAFAEPAPPINQEGQEPKSTEGIAGSNNVITSTDDDRSGSTGTEGSELSPHRDGEEPEAGLTVSQGRRVMTLMFPGIGTNPVSDLTEALLAEDPGEGDEDRVAEIAELARERLGGDPSLDDVRQRVEHILEEQRDILESQRERQHGRAV